MRATIPDSVSSPTTIRVVYIEDFGGWFRMSPRAWAEMVHRALQTDTLGEWDVRNHGGLVLRNKPRCVKMRLMDTLGGRWWEWAAPPGVALKHPRSSEHNIWYWQQEAEALADLGIGTLSRCGWCDECLESPDEPCESPVYHLPGDSVKDCGGVASDD